MDFLCLIRNDMLFLHRRDFLRDVLDFNASRVGQPWETWAGEENAKEQFVDRLARNWFVLAQKFAAAAKV